MSEIFKYIAVDLGAESGRTMLGTLAEGRVELDEIHRFSNGPVRQNDSLRWDFAKLMTEIKCGIQACVGEAGGRIAGIGVDSWGVDFGLLDEKGELIEQPYHYRDGRTDGMLDEAFKLMPRRDIFEHTGIQFMQINSLYQTLAMRLKGHSPLERARHLVFIADLVAHQLCGRIFAEYTLAGTSQMMNMRTGQWDEEVFERLDIPIDIMPEVIQPGTVVGRLTEEVAGEIGCDRIPVIACGSHDTACAVAAVPAEGDRWAYISSGTWSLMGLEIPDALVTDKSFEYDFTNEGGVEGTIRLLKNIMGLWVIQECRRQWQREGHDYSYPQLTEMAEGPKPFAARVDPNNPSFLAPGNMPVKVNNVLEQTGQEPVTDRGEMVRSVLEGLAFAYRGTLERLEDITGTEIDTIHIVGGGTQNELLNQFAANATGRTVITGPVEATSLGNVLMQAKAVGQVASLPAMRGVVRNSFPIKTYAPQDAEAWGKEYEKRTSES